MKKVHKISKPIFLFFIETDKIIRKKYHMVLKQKYTKSQYGNPFHYSLDTDYHSEEEIREYERFSPHILFKEGSLDNIVLAGFVKQMLSFNDDVEAYRQKLIKEELGLIDCFAESGLINQEELETRKADRLSECLNYKVLLL